MYLGINKDFIWILFPVAVYLDQNCACKGALFQVKPSYVLLARKFASHSIIELAVLKCISI